MNRLDETLLIDTPENITFGYEVAGIGSRFLAALIDTAAILALQILVNFIILFVYLRGFKVDLESGVFGPSSDASASWLIAALGLVSFLLLWGYYILFEIFWNGRSPGKRVVKLRVIRADGTPITAAESVVRNLVRLIDFLPFYYGVGVITMFINSQSRRLGDLAAGTIVVRENAAEVSLKSLAAPEINVNLPHRDSSVPGTLIHGDEYPVERLNQQDIQLIEQYLTRRGSLINRNYLSLQIARVLLAKMEVEKPYMAANEAEGVLEMILELYRRRLYGDVSTNGGGAASSSWEGSNTAPFPSRSTEGPHPQPQPDTKGSEGAVDAPVGQPDAGR